MRSRTVARSALAAGAVTVALAACSSDAPVAVTPPTPTGSAAAGCAALVGQLPAEVDGAKAVETTPASPYTAAWGDIVLVCGGDAPEVAPTAQLLNIDGVDWYPEKLPQGGTRFSTVDRAAVVTVSVPANHQPEADALVDLSIPVNLTLTSRPDKS